MVEGSDRIAVRAASDDELPAVMTILDAAMLEVTAETVRDRLAAGDGVLVAVEEGRVLGACVVDPTGAERAHVDAIAVRPGRRGQGIGTALVEAATDRWGSLTADFDQRVRPFYASLGFEVERVDDGFAGDRSRDERYRGRRG